MIRFKCMKKVSVEEATATSYSVWFQEEGRVREGFRGEERSDTEWQRYAVDKVQYDTLQVGQVYTLAPYPER